MQLSFPKPHEWKYLLVIFAPNKTASEMDIAFERYGNIPVDSRCAVGTVLGANVRYHIQRFQLFVYLHMFPCSHMLNDMFLGRGECVCRFETS